MHLDTWLAGGLKAHLLPFVFCKTMTKKFKNYFAKQEKHTKLIEKTNSKILEPNTMLLISFWLKWDGGVLKTLYYLHYLGLILGPII